MPVQVPSLVLPYPYVNVTSVELVADLLTHDSVDIPVEHLGEKTAIIWAMEVVLAAGAPGPLWAWVELSPLPSSVSGAFWSAIGGGAGPSYPAVPAMVPTAPTIEAGLGVNGLVHTPQLRWLNHSPYARVRIQTPAAGAAGSTWAVQVWFMARG
jgi:hypothetical protein